MPNALADILIHLDSLVQRGHEIQHQLEAPWTAPSRPANVTRQRQNDGLNGKIASWNQGYVTCRRHAFAKAGDWQIQAKFEISEVHSLERRTTDWDRKCCLHALLSTQEQEPRIIK